MCISLKKNQISFFLLKDILKEACVFFKTTSSRGISLFHYFFRGSALARRMRDRELEIQSDARDKHREMEEIEEVLRKQMSGESVADSNKSKRHTNSTVATSSSSSSGQNKENQVSDLKTTFP